MFHRIRRWLGAWYWCWGELDEDVLVQSRGFGFFSVIYYVDGTKFASGSTYMFAWNRD